MFLNLVVPRHTHKIFITVWGISGGSCGTGGGVTLLLYIMNVEDTRYHLIRLLIELKKGLACAEGESENTDPCFHSAMSIDFSFLPSL